MSKREADLEDKIVALRKQIKTMELRSRMEGPDPYLTYGVECHVYNIGDEMSTRASFVDFKEGRPRFYVPGRVKRFGIFYKVESDWYVYDRYKVLDTIWSHAPGWAKWVASDGNGDAHFFEAAPDMGEGKWVASEGRVMGAGYSVYGAWTNSLRARPEWAKE